MVIGYGKVKRIYKTLKPKKSMCVGCGDDFYNGHNPYGIRECWHFKKAKVVDAEFYLSSNSVEPTLIKETLSCYKG